MRYACDITEALITNENERINFIYGEHWENHNETMVRAFMRRSTQSNVTIQVLSNEFINHFENIETIDLWNTGIERITFNAFQRCGNIIEIELHHNRISSLHNGIFRNCRNLRFLNLEFNNFHTINMELFNGLVNLERLRMGYQHLHLQNDQVFTHLENLRELDIPFSYVHTISDKLLAPMKYLQTLYLAFCEISEIHPNAFTQNFNLSLIDIASNRITELPNGVFKNLTNLLSLRLNQNRIHRIGSESFGYHPQMNGIFMRNCSLNEVDPTFFENFPNLMHFNGWENRCIDYWLINVRDIDFETAPYMNECFYNWFHPSQPGHGSRLMMSNWMVLFTVALLIGILRTW